MADPNIVTVEAIYRELLVGRNELRELVDQGIIVKVKHNRYDFRKSAANIIKMLKHAPGAKSANEQFAVERARLYKTKADSSEVELALRKGEMGYISDFEKALTDGIVASKVSLLAIPRKMAPRLALISSAVRIEELLESEINASLKSLEEVDVRGQRRRPSDVGEEESLEELEPSAAVDDKPVGRRKSRTVA